MFYAGDVRTDQRTRTSCGASCPEELVQLLGKLLSPFFHFGKKIREFVKMNANIFAFGDQIGTTIFSSEY